MSKVCGHSFRTSLGWFYVVWADKDKTLQAMGVGYPDEAYARDRCFLWVDEWMAEPVHERAGLVNRLSMYCDGAIDDFADLELPLDEFNEFQRAVYTACRAIPRGQTRSYSQLATLAGRPNAGSAVGRMMRDNPWPILIPSHRAVTAKGLLGSNSDYRELSLHMKLLEMEGARSW